MPLRSFARSALWFTAVIALSASIAACGSSTDLLQIPTSWSLQTGSGHALPDTVPNSSPVIVITSGTAQLSDNHHYTFTLSGTTDGVPGVVGTDAGSWSVSSSTFLFRSSASAPHIDDYVAAFTGGNTFNVAMPGSILKSTDASVSLVFVSTQ